MGLASPFARWPTAIRINFLNKHRDYPDIRSHAFLEPAGKLAKTLDLGLGPFQRLQAKADVLEPGHIGVAGLLAKATSASFFSLSRAWVF